MCNKTLVMNRIKECIEATENHYGLAFKIPTVRFDKRGTVAGTANSGKYELNFNMVLLNENVEEFLHRTVAHEWAHLVDHIMYDSHSTRFDYRGRRKKRSVHGKTWTSIMHMLGVEASRSHSYDTTNSATRRKVRTYNYQCTGCGTIMEMSAIRHKRMQTAVRTYNHIGCKLASLILVK